MSVENLLVDWSDHDSELIGSFKYLLQSNTLVDCTLSAEGQCVKAHRVVLSASSYYFQLLFSQENEKHPIIILKDVKFQDLMTVIDFIYSGKVQISESQLNNFLETAEALQIKGLSNCGKHTKSIKVEVEDPNLLLNTDCEIYADQPVIDVNSNSNSNTTTATTTITTTTTTNNSIIDKNITFQDDFELTSSGMSNNKTHDLILSLDHPYCAESEIMFSCEQEILSSKITEIAYASSEGSVTECDVVTTETDVAVQPTVSLARDFSQRPNLVTKPDKRARLSQETEHTYNVANTGNREKTFMYDLKKSFVPKTVLAPCGQNIRSQRQSTTLNSKPKTNSSKQKFKTVLIGSKLCVVPHTAAVDRKDWLQPPKERNRPEKVYKCQACDKAFWKPSILAIHLRTHTGEKPYQCQECGRLFNQNSNFKRHLHMHTSQRLKGDTTSI